MIMSVQFPCRTLRNELRSHKGTCLLDNDSFGLQQLLSYKEKYRIATLKTTEKDAWDTYNKGKKIQIMEIK